MLRAHIVLCIQYHVYHVLCRPDHTLRLGRVHIACAWARSVRWWSGDVGAGDMLSGGPSWDDPTWAYDDGG